jgi:hypothetical protein
MNRYHPVELVLPPERARRDAGCFANRELADIPDFDGTDAYRLEREPRDSQASLWSRLLRRDGARMGEERA